VRASHRRTLFLARFAFLVGAGFVLLLFRADRAGAVELTAPVLPGKSIDVPVAAPAVPLDAVAPLVERVTPAPTLRPPTIAPVRLPMIVPDAIGAITSAANIDTTSPIASATPESAPTSAPSDLARGASSAPHRTGATTSNVLRLVRDGTIPTHLSPPDSPAPAPRPARPAVLAASALAGADGGSTQLAATLAGAIAVVILFPVGIARARRLVLPTLTFRPLARPG
jgi:hypothetical protein